MPPCFNQAVIYSCYTVFTVYIHKQPWLGALRAPADTKQLGTVSGVLKPGLDKRSLSEK